MTDLVSRTSSDPFHRVIDALDANFRAAPNRRAAHAKGVVAAGTFVATPEAAQLSRAAHFNGSAVPVVARFSNFPGGGPHPDAAPECNPRGLAVQFRLADGETTDLLAHSINGFPGRTVEDFSEFLEALAAGAIGEYLSTHGAAATFVEAVQAHRTPASFATVTYFAVNAFVFHDCSGTTTPVRYRWTPDAGEAFLDVAAADAADADYLATELRARIDHGPLSFTLDVQVAEPGDPTNDANAQWPDERRRVTLGAMQIHALVADSELTEQGLFFDPVRLLDGVTISDDPLLEGRTRTYPISLARRHRAP